MSEVETKALLSSTPESLCVRYLYDATGKIWFVDELARIVPAARLSRRTRGLVAASALAAPLLFQACGGNSGNGNYVPPSTVDGGAGAPSTGNVADTPDAGTRK